jgi:hypothetical protein
MSNEIIEVTPEADDTAISPLTEDTLLQVAREAEERIEAVKKIKMIVFKVTNKNDWIDQNGKPYMWVSGAEKVARVFGISYRIFEPVKTNLEGGHYRWEYKGEFSLKGASIEAIGMRASTDAFFGKSHGKLLPPSEIDEGNVKMAAYTNCVGNGITRLLGIRNMTWEELSETGITQGAVGKVEYGSKKETLSKKQAGLIQILKKKALEAGAIDEEMYRQVLANSFKAKSSTELSTAQASDFIDRLNKVIEEHEPPEVTEEKPAQKELY